MTTDEAIATLTKISEHDKALSREIARKADADSFEATSVHNRDTFRLRNFELLLDLAIWATAGKAS